MYNRKLHDDSGSFVVIDNAYGAEIAVGYLVNLGHRHIAYISGQMTFSTSIDRYSGYRQGLAQNNIEFDESLVYFGDYNYNKSYVVTAEILKNHPEVTAIFAGNDLMAIGAINSIIDRGGKVPEGISVVGFDDIELSGYRGINLTTISQEKTDMANCAFDILLKRIEDMQFCSRIWLKPQLLARGTCAPHKTEVSGLLE